MVFYKTDTVQIIKIETYSDIVDKMARKKYADKHPEILEPQHNLSDSENDKYKKRLKKISKQRLKIIDMNFFTLCRRWNTTMGVL